MLALTCGGLCSHSSIENRCFELSVNVVLMIELPVEHSLSWICTIFNFSICIDTIEIILRISKLTRVVDETVTGEAGGGTQEVHSVSEMMNTIDNQCYDTALTSFLHLQSA